MKKYLFLLLCLFSSISKQSVQDSSQNSSQEIKTETVTLSKKKESSYLSYIDRILTAIEGIFKKFTHSLKQEKNRISVLSTIEKNPFTFGTIFGYIISGISLKAICIALCLILFFYSKNSVDTSSLQIAPDNA